MIRKIVIPVRGDGKGDNVFTHAACLAKRYQAHVLVTHCRPRAEDLMPYGVVMPATLKKLLLEQSKGVADQVEDGMREELGELANQLGIALVEQPLANEACASWLEEQGRQVDVIKRYGRVADLICVAKPDLSRNLGSNTLKSALFNTGRPVMMCPPVKAPIEKLCDTVGIAWNGSIQASRAVACTTGILEQAKQVIVFSSGVEVSGASASSLVDYLEVRGVNVQVERFESKKNIGKDILDRCSAANVDTLLMGAYSKSHEAETILGGTTQYVVDNAEIPIVLVH